MKFSHIACALALAVSTAVQAAPVTFQFGGTLDGSDVEGYDAGTAVSGQFTYDFDTASLADPEPLGDGLSLLTYNISAPNSLTFNIGSDVISFSELGIALVDATGPAEIGDGFSITAAGMSINGVDGGGALLLTFMTSGANPDVLSLGLPATLQLADFDLTASGTYFTSTASDAQVASFNISSLSPVPEPASALTMLLGVGMVGGAMARRRHLAAR